MTGTAGDVLWEDVDEKTPLAAMEELKVVNSVMCL